MLGNANGAAVCRPPPGEGAFGVSVGEEGRDREDSNGKNISSDETGDALALNPVRWCLRLKGRRKLNRTNGC